jgi:hypothetical protein
MSDKALEAMTGWPPASKNVSFWPHCDGRPGCGITCALPSIAAAEEN